MNEHSAQCVHCPTPRRITNSAVKVSSAAPPNDIRLPQWCGGCGVSAWVGGWVRVQCSCRWQRFDTNEWIGITLTAHQILRDGMRSGEHKAAAAPYRTHFFSLGGSLVTSLASVLSHKTGVANGGTGRRQLFVNAERVALP